jgi:hypothetical protein
VTTDDLMSMLREHAVKDPESGRWYFGASRFPHSEKDALQIVEACASLGVPITDAVTSGAWLAMIRRIGDLERRMHALEARP